MYLYFIQVNLDFYDNENLFKLHTYLLNWKFIVKML